MMLKEGPDTDESGEKYPPEGAIILLEKGGAQGKVFYKGEEPWIKVELNGSSAELQLVPMEYGGFGIRRTNNTVEPPVVGIQSVYVQGESISQWGSKIGTVLVDRKTGRMVIAYKDQDGDIGEVESLDDTGSFGTAERHMRPNDIQRIQNLNKKEVMVETDIPYSEVNPSEGAIPKGKYVFCLEGSFIVLRGQGGKRYERVPIQSLEHLHRAF